MDSSFFYLLAADVILLLHILIVIFNVGGLVMIIIGYLLKWDWVCNPWFRLTHILAIIIVVIQSWIGVVCPFTTLEMVLRSKAGEAVYPGTFISYWLENILYYQVSPWFFTIIYTVFGVLVVLSWFIVRPRPFK
ncbi:MAG: DUF2784 domain-containing protein [Gammaproteobacteria bacterium]|nr:DUF2784 domain-containing protein [Gammaproteobacteria bacterium]MCW8988669.1 DUF2784 domain-containing protein [Gammaproteobacteria bacterium]MCW9032036.1 DUF2784 domain-containing protein [Gammaproteobacteria bacterium]